MENKSSVEKSVQSKGCCSGLVNYSDDDDDDESQECGFSGQLDSFQQRKKFKGATYDDHIQANSLDEKDNEDYGGGEGVAINEEVDPYLHLQEMGFCGEKVACALKVCGEKSSIFELSDFLQAHYGNVEDGKIIDTAVREDAVESLGDEGGDQPMSVKKLQKMGFTLGSIQRAAEACGSLDFEELLDFLIDAEKDDMHPLEDGLQPQKDGHWPWKYEEEDEIDYGGGQGGAINEKVDPHIRLQEMGFPREQVACAIKVCGEKSSIFELSDFLEAHYGNFEDGQTYDTTTQEDTVESFGDEGGDECIPLKKLQKMGFTLGAVQRAAEACGSLDLEELLGFLIDSEKDGAQPHEDGWQPWKDGEHISSAEAGPSRSVSSSAKISGEENLRLWNSYPVPKNIINDTSVSDESGNECSERVLKKAANALKVKRGRKRISTVISHDEENLPTEIKYGRMMGFGVPGLPVLGRPKPLNRFMEGPPFFYFENVASVPNSEWDTIKRHLNGIDPEFVDSKYFSASQRPRGYVHNLPIDGRKLVVPTPPMTIFEAFPKTRKFWPSWDTREKLNCINTRRAPDTLCSEIRRIVGEHEGMDIPLCSQQMILKECKKWNLVWVGPGQVAPLEPHEIELLLGFELDHTRGSSTITDRYEALGNSFQINTVAYHLSPLKFLYPHGLTVLSLFSGIGGAEVALHKLGIFLKAVVIVETDSKTRNVIESWWKKTWQKGKLIIKEDVRNLTNEVLAELVNQVGSFDLIIGGSPCNNLSGNNRVSRVGLQGKESCLFYEFPRILNIVKQIIAGKG